MGAILSQPFESDGRTEADRGRQGLVTLSVSAAPNGYVVFIPNGHEMLLHRLVRVAPNLFLVVLASIRMDRASRFQGGVIIASATLLIIAHYITWVVVGLEVFTIAFAAS